MLLGYIAFLVEAKRANLGSDPLLQFVACLSGKTLYCICLHYEFLFLITDFSDYTDYLISVKSVKSVIIIYIYLITMTLSPLSIALMS